MLLTFSWEQRRLGEVIEGLYNGQTPSRFNKDNWNGSINWLSSGELNRSIVVKTVEKISSKGKSVANLKVIPKGTVVIAITGLEAAGTRGNCAKLGIDTTLNQSCMAIFPKREILDSDYLFHWYKKIGESYGIRYTQGTKQQSYNAEIIKILPITLPKIEEQQVIARFLDDVDHQITVQQRKSVSKDEVMNLFLCKSNTLVDVDVYANSWEQRRLGEVSCSYSGGTPSAGNKEYYGGMIPFIRSGEISSSCTELFLTEKGFENSSASMIDEGDILYALYGATSGEVSKAKIRGAINQAILAIKPIEGYESEYILQYLQNMKGRILARYLQGGQGNLSAKIIKELIIHCPGTFEQKQIGQFFELLDHHITFQQRM